MTIPLRPTVRGWVMIFTALAGFAVALVNVNLASALMASGITAIVIASFLLSLFSLYRIEVIRDAPRDGIKGELVTQPVQVINHSRRIRQAVVVRERFPFCKEKVINTTVAPLSGKERRTVNRRVWAFRRGHFELGKLSLLGGDPAGLFLREKKYNFPAELVIYPETTRLSWMPIRIRSQLRASTTGRPTGVSGLGEEFFGVREHRPSDGVRFIHWKASARCKRLMVREFEANAVTQVTLILDTNIRHLGNDKTQSNYEYLVNTAASIVEYLSGMYCRMMFVAGDHRMPHPMIIDGQAFSVRNDIMEFLATSQPTRKTVPDIVDSCFELIEPHSIVYYLTMSDDKGTIGLFETWLSMGIDVRWIYAPKQLFPLIIESSGYETPMGTVDESKHSLVPPYLVRRGTSLEKVLTYG